MGKWIITILFLVASALLTHWLPFSSFFRNVDTMIHEFAHAVVTLLLSGQVYYIYLFADHSGVTLSALPNGWKLFPVALAGYVLASLFAVYLFAAYRKGKPEQGMWVMTLLGVLSLVLFVRNPFGVMWVAGFVALNLITIFVLPSFLQKAYYLLITFLCLEESVFGPVSLLFVAFVEPNQAGDASSLAEMTGISAVLWAGLFTLFSLWCAKRSLQSFFGRRQKKHITRETDYMHAEP